MTYPEAVRATALGSLLGGSEASMGWARVFFLATGNQAAAAEAPAPVAAPIAAAEPAAERRHQQRRRQRQSQHQLFHQQFSGSKWLRAQGQRQPQHRVSAPKNARRQVEAISSPPPFPRRHLRHHSGCVTRQLHGSCHTHTSCRSWVCSNAHLGAAFEFLIEPGTLGTPSAAQSPSPSSPPPPLFFRRSDTLA